jgi:DNA-binding NarL/FixJ family response regulator
MSLQRRGRIVSLIDGDDPLGPRLTPREKAVLTLMSEGYTAREIAEKLGMALGTVRQHMANIVSKLGPPEGYQ